MIDSEHVWDEVREELARERGGRWHERAQADMMGMSAPEWSRYMHDVIGLSESPEEINNQVVERMLEALRRAAPAHRRRGRRRRANRGGVPARARVVVESPRDRRRPRDVGPRGVFEVTVSSEEVAHGKPAPDVFLEAARRLERPARALRGGRGLGERHPRRACCGHARHRDPRTAATRRPRTHSRWPTSCWRRSTSSTPSAIRIKRGPLGPPFFPSATIATLLLRPSSRCRCSPRGR